MVVNCLIEFDNNPYGTYFAGQVISGKVTLQADRPKQVKAIVLKIKGCASTHWTESTSHNSQKHGSKSSDTSYNGHEDYLSSCTYLLGSDACAAIDLQPGVHIYNFSCHIPSTCPSSFEGSYGYIRYLIKVALIRPWKFDQTYTKGFTVLKVMDLNYDTPLLKVPCKQEAQKTFGCGPCRSQPLNIDVSLPQSGFVPGQLISVNVLVSNNSHVPIENLKVELTMLVCYYSQTPTVKTKPERIVLAKIKGDPVLKYCNKQFNYQLLIPATPPTCFNLCRIIQIAYQVEVEAKVKGLHSSQVVCVPVTIGNVPFNDVIQQQPCSSQDMVNMPRSLITNADANDNTKDGMEDLELRKVENETPLAPASPWPSEVTSNPPSYEEAVHVLHAKINEDEAHDYGESDFVPRYPVFHLDQTPSAPSPDTEKIDKGTWL